MTRMTRAAIEVGQARSGLGITLLCGASFAALPAARWRRQSGRSAGTADRRSDRHHAAAGPGHADAAMFQPMCRSYQRQLGRQRQSNLGDYLEQNPTSVTVNAAQGNPFQADINFRGFTASPLLGTPQGLSVFQDGVRINEPFGDVVNWDLLPQSAIAEHSADSGLEPRVRPQHPRRRAGRLHQERQRVSGRARSRLSGGSFGRQRCEFEHGGKRGNLDYFVTGNHGTRRRLGRAQCQPHPPVLRQGRLAERADRLRRQPDRRRQQARRHADPAAVLLRQHPAGLHLPDRNKQQADVPDRQGQPLPLRHRAGRRQPLLPQVQEQQLSAATSTTSSAQSTPTPARSARSRHSTTARRSTRTATASACS